MLDLGLGPARACRPTVQVLGPVAAVKLVCDALAEGQTAEEATRQLAEEAVRLADGPTRAQGAADNTTVSLFVFVEL